MYLIETTIKCKNGVTKKFFIRDLTGKRFYKLIALERIKKGMEYFWKCKCDCGTESIVSGSHLIDGHTRSCGCLIIEGAKKRKKHGRAGTKEYKAWCSMISRCTNPKNASYIRYKEAGRSVCEGWLNSFDSFYLDLGDRPQDKPSLERANNDLGYSCGHCDECKSKGLKRNGQWDTWEVQVRNRSTTVLFNYNGESMIINDWAKKYNIQPYTLLTRIKRGWSFKVALETPTRKQHNSLIK